VGVRLGLTILLAVLALLSLLAAAAWLIGVFAEREAVGQTSREQTITAPPSVSPEPKTAQPLSLLIPRRRAGGRLG
jgi:Na+-transporting methylmalonyl-CoA/oxaloacetate decarboxylase gamma subunit